MKISLIHGSPVNGITRFDSKKANSNNVTIGVTGGIFGTYFYWGAKGINLDIFLGNLKSHTGPSGSIYKCEYDLQSDKAPLNGMKPFNFALVTNVLVDLFPEYSSEAINWNVEKLKALGYTNFQAMNTISQMSVKHERVSKFIDVISQYTPAVLLGDTFGTAIFFDNTGIEILEEIKVTE